MAGLGLFYWNDHSVIEMRSLSQPSVYLFALCICISPTCVFMSASGSYISKPPLKAG